MVLIVFPLEMKIHQDHHHHHHHDCRRGQHTVHPNADLDTWVNYQSKVHEMLQSEKLALRAEK